jgi:probable addiction module antidote protein
MSNTVWDMADNIKTPDDVTAYLHAAAEDNDPEFFLAVLGDVARSEGMARIATELGVSRESLYRSLSAKGNPSFATVVRTLNTLGLRIDVVAKASHGDAVLAVSSVS